MQATPFSAPASPVPPLDGCDGDMLSVDCGELSRSLLIVLARSQLADRGHVDRHVDRHIDKHADRHADAQALGLEHAVRAALSVLQCEVPWDHGRHEQHEQRLQWAQAPDVLTEHELVRWLLMAGLAAVALGRPQPAFLIYGWLRGALQDPSELHLVWAAALLGAQHTSQAQACLSRLERPDELAQALQALTLLPAAPQEAVQRLRQVQAQATQPPVRTLLDAVLQALQHDADGANDTDGTNGSNGTDRPHRAAADPLPQSQRPSASSDG